MTRPTQTRAQLRMSVLGKLDPTAEPKSSSCTSDADALDTLIDTILAPAAQSEDYVGDWIYVRTQPTKVDSGANIAEGGIFSSTDTTLTVTDGTKFTVGDGIQIEPVSPSIADEILRVTVIATNDLTVVRGIQGTPAATHNDGEDIYIVGPAVGEIVQVTNVGFGGTNSQLTVAPDFSCSLVSGQEYERHRKVSPSLINAKLDATMGVIRQTVLVPATLVTDGDMEATNVDDWTDDNATSSKETTIVKRGRQSLKIVASAANGRSKAASVYLPGGTVVIVESDVYITPGDSCKLTFYDVTNSAVIGTALESDESGWVHLEDKFTVPATCEEVQVWPEAQGNGDVCYFDHITLWPTRDASVDLPSFLEFISDVQRIVYIPAGQKIEGSTNVGAYRIDEGTPTLWSHYKTQRDDTGVVSARLYLANRPVANALWIEARKPFDAFAGATDAAKDAATSAAHKNVVVNMTTASIIDDLALEALEAEKFKLAEGLQQKAAILRFDVQNLMSAMSPPKRRIITTPWRRLD